jgi:hypothetical protein
MAAGLTDHLMDMADVVRVMLMNEAESNRERVRCYPDRAEECRTHAADMQHPDARAGLIRAAEAYERMANAIAQAMGDYIPPIQTETLPIREIS